MDGGSCGSAHNTHRVGASAEAGGHDAVARHARVEVLEPCRHGQDGVIVGMSMGLERLRGSCVHL